MILSRGRAAEALEWTRGRMARLELTLNEAKTSLWDARKERFDFLGYTFGPHWRRKDGRRYLGASPSRKSVQRMKDKAGALLRPRETGPWPAVRDRLNDGLRGWKGYFRHGSLLAAYTAIDRTFRNCVRAFLTRRHKVPGRGTRQFFSRVVFRELGVVRLMVPRRRGP